MSTVQFEHLSLRGAVLDYQALTMKTRCYYDQVTGPTLEDSYAVSSVTDNATGRATMNFSVTFKDTYYTYTGTAGNDGTSTTNRYQQAWATDNTRSAVALQISSAFSSSTAAAVLDTAEVAASTQGELG